MSPTRASASDGPPQPTPPRSGQPAAQPPVPEDVAALSYEAARDELIALVARLESGQVGLEESVRLWQRGEALATHCQTWLDRAESALGVPESQPGG